MYTIRICGAPKVNAPLADPSSRVIVRFYPEPTLTYKLWVRLKADGNNWANDSVWLQFSAATDASGTPKYRSGSAPAGSRSISRSAPAAACRAGAGKTMAGARVNVNGGLLRFPSPDYDPQYMVIQTREDGVSIDQIVFSAEKYLTTPPGPAKNDTTILRVDAAATVSARNGIRADRAAPLSCRGQDRRIALRRARTRGAVSLRRQQAFLTSAACSRRNSRHQPALLRSLDSISAGTYFAAGTSVALATGSITLLLYWLDRHGTAA